LQTYGLAVGATTAGLGYIQAQRADGTATTYDLTIQPNGGRVGIGTTSPGGLLDVTEDSNTGGASDNANVYIESVNRNANLHLTGSASNTATIYFGDQANALAGRIVYQNSNDSLYFGTNSSAQHVTIDSSGRLLVGTSSSSDNISLAIAGNSGGSTADSKLLLVYEGSAPNDGNTISSLSFRDNSHLTTADNYAAEIKAQRDGGTWTSGSSMPGRLVFSTTADGASSPTERMRITSDGSIDINAGDVSGNPRVLIRTGSNTPLSVDRFTDDGNVIDIRQANTIEGAISVSGTTVTYGGGHLARWSQLPNNEDPSNILKGTVMSNLDQMCEWGEEDNEQLNRTNVSEIEGDPDVAGVFVSTSFSDEGPLDFYVAMTGDMIIRIAQGVTVQRGDLLMSAGDGTAKPQDDDIIRSKTIAKVTSTHVTCTYDDGSYCVPCVLMAC